ncbi:MAG: RdgB/HAM1 family non-canonical purine NTP pyrophosphatase [Bacteroidales bacterium]|nr:RdgB/HAM1 family non-canonical purine NTP pyrophosphatase [Bacteroidales bacterium]
MITKLVFASQNKGKINEIKSICKGIQVSDLREIGLSVDIKENGKTFCENAYIKASYVYNKIKMPVFADDSGLEVPALNYAPGIFSARYAGEDASDEQNITKLLNNLINIKNREAQFVCCICLIINGIPYYFTGILKGHIINDKRGTNGFGYDPIFIPQGFDKTLAELSLEEKNRISHRYKALKKMLDFLSKI